jgi:arylsulfatase A-like enzyme
MKLGYKVDRLYFLIELMWWLRDRLPSGAPGTAFAGNDAGDMNASLLAWMAERPEVPHFAYVHYMEAHAPYDPPAPWDVLYDARGRALHVTDPPRGAELSFPLGNGQALTDDELASAMALYDGEISYWDRRFGALLDGLEELGVRDRTIVLVTADHGEEFYEHGSWEHGDAMYDEQIHVPLIAQWPESHAAPRIDRRLAQHVDLFPTALEAAGAAAEGLGLPGFSLIPRLVGTTGAATPGVLTEVFHGGFQVQSLRTVDAKYVRCVSASREHAALFDLMSDPAELRDLSETAPALRDSLAAEFELLRAAAAEGGVLTEGVSLDPETEAHLRALGYIE